MATSDITEFVAAVDQAYTRIKGAGPPDANEAFVSVFSFDEIREDEEKAEKLAIGGDPTLDVQRLGRKFSEPIEDLGYARVIMDDEQDYGVGQIDEDYVHVHSPPGNPSWSKFESVRDYFCMEDELETDLRSPASYAAFIGISEAPIAVLVRTAWGNGCKLTALLCTESYIYVIKNTNG